MNIIEGISWDLPYTLALQLEETNACCLLRDFSYEAIENIASGDELCPLLRFYNFEIEI